MSDTVKLIIEIPKNYYEVLKTLPDDQLGIELAIKYGTPLDDVKAEIDQYLFQNEFGSEYRKEVSQIIDKHIGKAESEDKE